MAGFNKTILMGNITRDIELRYTPGGKAVCDIGLAVNEKRKSGEEVMFIDCTLWDKTAELGAEYLAKGRQVLFEGRLRQDTWDDKDTGAKRSKIGLTVDKMVFVGGKDDNQQPRQRQQQQQYTPDQQQQMDTPLPPPQNQAPPRDEDIPF